MNTFANAAVAGLMLGCLYLAKTTEIAKGYFADVVSDPILFPVFSVGCFVVTIFVVWAVKENGS